MSRAPELGHVGQQRRRDLLAGARDVLTRGERFHEDDVGAGFAIFVGTRDRHRQTEAAAASVRAQMRMSFEALFAAATLRHISSTGTSFLSLRWPHFLGNCWSSICTRRRRSPPDAHGLHHVERLAEAGVAIDDQRQIGRAHDLARLAGHLVEGEQPEIGQRHRRGEGCAGEIERFEPGLFCQQRRNAVIGARDRAMPVLRAIRARRRAAVLSALRGRLELCCRHHGSPDCVRTCGTKTPARPNARCLVRENLDSRSCAVYSRRPYPT